MKRSASEPGLSESYDNSLYNRINLMYCLFFAVCAFYSYYTLTDIFSPIN